MSETPGVYRIKRQPAQRSSEHEQQATVAAWAKLRERDYPELALLFAVPNGGKRHIKTALFLRAEGVKAGVPDLWLPVPRRDRPGWVCEMKWGRNKLTPEQEWWLQMLAALGWETHVFYSAGAAIESLECYLQEPQS